MRVGIFRRYTHLVKLVLRSLPSHSDLERLQCAVNIKLWINTSLMYESMVGYDAEFERVIVTDRS